MSTKTNSKRGKKGLNTKAVATVDAKKYKRCVSIPGIFPSSSFKSSNKALSSDYKCLTGGSVYKQAVVAKIEQHLKTTYLIGEDSIYDLKELLHNAKIAFLSDSITEWLVNEALPRSDIVKCDKYIDGVTRYSYNPPLPCATESELLELLMRKREEPVGVLDTDIIASVPQATRVLSSLEDKLCSFERQDKKKVFFYDPPQLSKPSWFQDLIRSSSVYSYNDEKIEDYLRQQDISPARDLQLNKPEEKLAPKPSVRKRKLPARSSIRDNAHVADLETYHEFM